MSRCVDGAVAKQLLERDARRAHWLLLAAISVTLCPHLAEAGSAGQSDWSCGPGVGAAASEWGCTFVAADGVSWWRNLGGDPVAWSKQVISASFAMAHHVVPSDIDGDSDLDLVGAAYQLSRLGLWRNEGGEPVQWNREVAGGIAGALVLEVRDLDGDGRPDLVATSDAEDVIDWWRNVGGNPREWPEQTVAEGFAGALPVVVADLDGNGALCTATATTRQSGPPLTSPFSAEPIARPA